MKIKKLNLRNFRCFAEMGEPIEFHDQMTVFAASNGRGKSSILDAITVAISPYTRVFEHGEARGFRKTDASLRLVRINRPDGRAMFQGSESLYPVKLEAAFECGAEIITIERQLSGPRSSTTVKEARGLENYALNLVNEMQQKVQEKPPILPVISYYGTGRLHAQKKLTKRDRNGEVHNSGSRTMGYLNCLSSESTYKHFAEWMKDTTLAHLQELNPEYESGDPGFSEAMLAGVLGAVKIVLEDQRWSNLRYTVKLKQLTVNENSERIPLALLSDGLRSIIAMIGDLAYRTIVLNPHLASSAPTRTPGIVLIDEVEMHLHPAWQQRILTQLVTAFPLIQFICTSHSPQVLSTVRSESIRTISEEGRVASPACKTFGAESKRVLEELMGVDSRPPVLKNELNEFIQLTDSGDWSSQRYLELRALLLKELGASDPFLIDAEIKQNFQQLLESE